jgi:ElaB/YqjD/DUF883 family membrane-anchored ribosome-binding protein
MAENNHNTVEDFTESAQEQLERAGTFLGKQANELRKTVANQLREAKKSIRTQVKGRELDKEQKAQVDNVLKRLDSMADFLENHTVEQMEKQATKAIQQNVWRNLLFAFVVGLIVGILFSRD